MDVYDAIHTRSSVRAYEPRDVEQDKLLRILDAGRLAPSARNAQQWRFVVVRDGGRRQELARAADQPFLADAPVIIAVVSFAGDRLMHCGIPAGPVDCAIAIDHMALAATAEGLGTCWIGHFNQQACCRVLNVPGDGRIIEMLVLGYPAVPAGAKKRKPLDEIVSYEQL